MRNIILLIIWIPFNLTAQVNDNVTPDFIPKWSVQLDLLNFQDNYPAALFSIERQLDRQFAIHQEFGPVIIPEAYFDYDFDQYLGFKGRTELRLFMDENPAKRSRTFLSIDLAYQSDQYVYDYIRAFDNFGRRESGKFNRWVFGSHIRGGYQRVFGQRVIFSYSLGIGRLFYWFDAPPEYEQGNTFNDPEITLYPPLDPFNMNIRLKIGFILSKLVE